MVDAKERAGAVGVAKIEASRARMAAAGGSVTGSAAEPASLGGAIGSGAGLASPAGVPGGTKQGDSGIHKLKEKMCPSCKSKSFHRSQMRGLVERGILRTLGIRAYRCRECDKRFYRFGGKGGRDSSQSHRAELKESGE